VGKITGLRSFLQEEMVVKDRVSTDYEIARMLYTNQDKTLVFENVADYSPRVVGNLCYSRESLYRALSTSKEGYNEKVARAVENPLIKRGDATKTGRRVSKNCLSYDISGETAAST
jgi:UbiD family decarboxylase